MPKDKWTLATKTENVNFYTKEESLAAGMVLSSDNATTGAFQASSMAGNYVYTQSIYIFGGNATGYNTATYYIDNIKLWYKAGMEVNYHTEDLPDVLKTAVDEVLKVSGTTVYHREYMPRKALPVPDFSGTGYRFIGWSASPDNDDEVITQAVTGEYDLYPLYEYCGGLDATAYTLKADGTSTSTVSYLNGAVSEWNVDLGNTNATYAVTDGKLVVTAGTYAGTITVTASTADGDKTLVIKSYGSTAIHPGLNAFNGLTTPVSFEDNFDYGIYISQDFSRSFVDGATKVFRYSDGAAVTSHTGKVLRCSTEDNGGTQWIGFNFNTAVEAGRPFYFYVLNYMNSEIKETGANWFINFRGSNSHWSPSPQYNATNLPALTWYYRAATTPAPPADNTSIYYQIKTTPDADTEPLYRKWFNMNTYWDDFLLVPYYKITYTDASGENTATVYELPRDSYTILPTYTPDPSKLGSAYAGKACFIDGVQYTAADPYPVAYHDFTVVVKDAAGFTDGSATQYIDLTGDTFTVPSPEALGFATANFIGWTNADGSRAFLPGETVNTADVNGKIFTAFYQDASKPAMGFAIEGDPDHSFNNTFSISAFNLKSHTVDADGRPVYHVGSDADAGTATDGRFQIAVKDSSFVSAREYYMFELARKNNAFGTLTTANTRIFWHPAGGSYSCAADGTHQGPGIKHTVGTSYVRTVYNLKDVSKTFKAHVFGNPNVPDWNVGQIWYDLAQVSPKTNHCDIDFLYLRLYRAGITTVKYYDGETLLYTETGRGVGTGYLLDTMTFPEKEGYLFVGWADENGNLYEDGKLDLTGDTSVYAKFVKAPVTDTEAFSVKLMSNSSMGLRFRGTVEKSDKTVADEYGFLISTAEKLNGNALTFDLADGKYVKGAAFIKGEKDLVYAENEETVTFTAACYGIPAGKYDVDLYARTYLKTGGFTFYGETAVQNIQAQAQKYASADPASEAGQFYALHKDAIDAIIANA